MEKDNSKTSKYDQNHKSDNPIKFQIQFLNDEIEDFYIRYLNWKFGKVRVRISFFFNYRNL